MLVDNRRHHAVCLCVHLCVGGGVVVGGGEWHQLCEVVV